MYSPFRTIVMCPSHLSSDCMRGTFDACGGVLTHDEFRLILIPGHRHATSCTRDEKDVWTRRFNRFVDIDGDISLHDFRDCPPLIWTAIIILIRTP